MKLFKAFSAFALVIALSSMAYAETQNVKVSGDLNIRSINRWNYDQRDADTTVAEGSGVGESNYYDNNHQFLMTTEIQIDADLTDNVSTVVRLANEAYWGEETDSTAYDVGVVKAYVTLKEMLYSPLTLKIGRQSLWFGKGFIVGSNTAMWNPEGAIASGIHSNGAQELSVYNTFDAIRATLDYDPWTIDLAYAKIDENSIDEVDDIDLYIVNIGYVFDSYQGEAEAYYVGKMDLTDTAVAVDSTNDINTIGLRGSFDPLENLTLAGEGAYQFGSYVDNSSASAQTVDRDRDAWALDISAEWRIPDMRWTPTIGLEYIYYSGNGVDNTTGDFEGWDPVFRGKFDTLIHDFRAVPYGTFYGPVGGTTGLNESAQYAGSGTPNADNASTNRHQILLSGSVNPTDSTTLTAVWGHFWLDEDISNGSSPSGATGFNDDHIGDEIDIIFTYDYTEDVQFTTAAGWFLPGDHYSSDNDETAASVVTGVHVSF